MVVLWNTLTIFFIYAYYVFCFKQKTAYEMRISDWSSDVCTSDVTHFLKFPAAGLDRVAPADINAAFCYLVATLRPDTMFVPFIGDVHLDLQLSFLSSLVPAPRRGALAPLSLSASDKLSESAERRGGKEWVSSCRSRWSPYH